MNLKVRDFAMYSIAPEEMLKILFSNSIEAHWIWNLHTMQFEEVYINSRNAGLIPEDVFTSMLVERVLKEDRKRVLNIIVEHISIAKAGEKHIKIPPIYTHLINGYGNYVPAVINLTVYYDQNINDATLLVGDIRIDYKQQYIGILNRILSKREKECLSHVLNGKSHKEILRLMMIENSTLSTYKKNIVNKSGYSLSQIKYILKNTIIQ